MQSLTTEARNTRARLAAATRKYGPDHDTTRAIRSEWDGERWVSAVTLAVSAVFEAVGAVRPPLTESQEIRLAEALARVRAIEDPGDVS